MTLARSAVQLLGVYYMDNANALGRDYVWNLLRGGVVVLQCYNGAGSCSRLRTLRRASERNAELCVVVCGTGKKTQVADANAFCCAL